MKQGREFRQMLDLFFQHFLVCMLGREVVLSHLFAEFRAWWDAEIKKSSVRSLLERLRRFSDAYQTFRDPSRAATADPVLSRFLRRLKVLDTGTVYPVLLFLIVELNGKLERSERDKILTDLESFLVRRWLCGVTSKNYNRFFTALIVDFRKGETIDHTVVRQRLTSGTGDMRWPDEAEFKKKRLDEPAYKKVQSSGIEMVLEAIHLTMPGSKQEGVSIEGGLTVEHIMPRKWPANWPLPSVMEDGGADDETPVDRRERMIHTFGNLTLLTQSLNSNGSVSNSGWDTKRRAITRQSLLRLNAYFQDKPEWNEDAITKRGLELFERAQAIWPRPKATVSVATEGAL